MNIHMNRPNPNAGENGEVVGEIDIDKMKRYISYCKSYVAVRASSPCHSNSFKLRKCAPRLSPDAQEMLSSHFVGLRKQVQQVEQDNDERSSIPITVRSAHSCFPYFFHSPTHVAMIVNWRQLSASPSHLRK